MWGHRLLNVPQAMFGRQRADMSSRCINFGAVMHNLEHFDDISPCCDTTWDLFTFFSAPGYLFSPCQTLASLFGVCLLLCYFCWNTKSHVYKITQTEQKAVIWQTNKKKQTNLWSGKQDLGFQNYLYASSIHIYIFHPKSFPFRVSPVQPKTLIQHWPNL